MKKIIQVSLDTNVLDPVTVEKNMEAANGLTIEFANVTVSEHELEGTSLQPLPNPIFETAVWDESRWNQTVGGVEGESDLFEKLLNMVSNSSFPRSSIRISLTNGQRRQMRDVMILVAHTRERRDILVTNDKKAFSGKGGVLRKKLEMICSTCIMNADEFCSFCNSLQKGY